MTSSNNSSSSDNPNIFPLLKKQTLFLNEHQNKNRVNK